MAISAELDLRLGQALKDLNAKKTLEDFGKSCGGKNKKK